jgi:hypothetical protein
MPNSNRQNKQASKLRNGKKQYTQRHIRITEAMMDKHKPKLG